MFNREMYAFRLALLRVMKYLMLLAGIACSQAPTTLRKVSRHDPYWGGLLDYRTLSLYPDSALWVADVFALRASDSLPMEDSTTVVAHRGGGGFIGDSCGSFSSGQGFVGDYLVRAEFYVIVGPRDSLLKYEAGPDTLANYVTEIWNPLLSPLPGWGDDYQHQVIWRLTLTDSTPTAPIGLLPVAEPQDPVGSINWGPNCNGIYQKFSPP